MPEQILVSPLQVLKTGWEMSQSGELWDHLGVSLYRLFVGFGIGSVSGVVFGVLLGLSGSLRSYVEVAQVYCFSRWQVIRTIVLPSIIPATLTGVRIALSRAWMVLVGAELLAAESGLGQMMELGRQMFRLDIVMLGVVLTGVIGFSLDRGFRLLEGRLMRWKKG